MAARYANWHGPADEKRAIDCVNGSLSIYIQQKQEGQEYLTPSNIPVLPVFAVEKVFSTVFQNGDDSCFGCLKGFFALQKCEGENAHILLLLSPSLKGVFCSTKTRNVSWFDWLLEVNDAGVMQEEW